MSPHYLPIIQTVAIVAAPLVALGAWLKRTFQHILRNEVVDLIDDKLASIKSELVSNGGSSLRDKVDGIATAVDRQRATDDRRHRENQQRLESAENHLEQQDGRLDRMQRALIVALRNLKDPKSDELLVELDSLEEQARKPSRRKPPAK